MGILNKLINELLLGSGLGVGIWYIIVLYFMLISLMSIGFGNVVFNIDNEKIFFVIMMLIGGK